MVNLKIHTESSKEYRVDTKVQTFKDYFVSRFHQIRKLLIDCLSYKNITPIDIKSLKQSKKQEEYIIARIFEITETQNYINFILDDLQDFIECRYKRKENQTTKFITDIVLSFKIYKRKYISEIIFPDISISPLKVVDRSKKIFASLISDIHVGSKLFEQDKFIRYIQYINSIPFVKYMILCGDLIDGVGVYPDQEKDLGILNVELQYKKLAELLSLVRKDITLIISPGNHDYLPVEEPQDILDKKFRDLFEVNRTIFLPNPCLFDLQGILYLMYHGRGMDSLLASGKFSADGDRVFELSEYLLKVRHLSPSYDAKNTNFILNKDLLVVNRKPDVFHIGHIHRGFIKDYKGTLICNAGTWQKQTDFQKRMDLYPDLACFLLINLNNLNDFSVKYIQDNELHQEIPR
jgi:DNA polymerase II small subunit